MTQARRDATILLLLASALLILFGSFGSDAMGDFRDYFYSARTLLAHQDPYNREAVDAQYRLDAPSRPQPDAISPTISYSICNYINLPNGFLFSAPVAALGWKAGHWLWLALIEASLLSAAWLMGWLHRSPAPVLSAALAAVLLLGGISQPCIGNISALSIALSVLAAYCLVEERLPWLGVAALALALIAKPHDAAGVWLFFFVAGGSWRKRALQAAALFAGLSLPGLLATLPVAPHWMAELQANLAWNQMPGHPSDPRPFSLARPTNFLILDLQATVAIFVRSARVYQLLPPLLMAPLLALWAVAVRRNGQSRTHAWMALAAISALWMLPVYHRLHDAKLLFLAIPACAALWAARAPGKRLAVTLLIASAVLTTELIAGALNHFADSRQLTLGTLREKLLLVVLGQPATLCLLATGLFFLWQLWRQPRQPANA